MIEVLNRLEGVNVIREMDINDYSNVMSLWGRTKGIGLSESDERENISAFLSRNTGLSYVFIQDSIIVGAVLCGHDGRRGYIYHLAVESEYRGNKIGSKLITTCLDGLKAIGIKKCHLFVFNENELGKNFWTGNGWKLRGDILVFSNNL